MNDDKNLDELEGVEIEEARQKIDLSSHYSETENVKLNESQGSSEGEGVAVESVIDIPEMVCTGVELVGSLVFGESGAMTESEQQGFKSLVPQILAELGLEGDGKVSVWGALAAFSVAYAVPRFFALQAEKMMASEPENVIDGGGDLGDISTHGN